jgi:hypothetical protein
VRGFRASGRKFDRFDLLAFAYLAIVAAYAITPRLFAVNAPTAFDARSLALRESAGFVILMVAARYAQLPDDFMSRAARVLMVVGSIVAAFAVYEYFFSDAWNQFVVDRVGYLKYQVEVLGSTTLSGTTDIRRYGYLVGGDVLRVGSVFVDPIRCGFYLVLSFAVAVEHRLRVGRRRGSVAVLVLIGTALLFTQTRAALIGALAVAFFAVRPAAGRPPNRRLQFACVFAALIVFAIPAAQATGLTERVSSTTSREDQSTSDHIEGFWNGVSAVNEKPLGHGLGTSAGIGQRFHNASARISENYYLQVGIETGMIAMTVFIALTIALIRRLQRATRTVADLGVSAVRGAAVGLATGALFLHTWIDLPVAWSFWGLAGAALGMADRAASPRSRPVDDDTDRPAQAPLFGRAR